jgi:hypothetical protein
MKHKSHQHDAAKRPGPASAGHDDASRPGFALRATHDVGKGVIGDTLKKGYAWAANTFIPNPHKKIQPGEYHVP